MWLQKSKTRNQHKKIKEQTKTHGEWAPHSEDSVTEKGEELKITIIGWNKGTPQKNLWDIIHVVLKKDFIAINTHNKNHRNT